VEAYFATQKVLATYYWLGLEKRQNLYYWQDGTRVNNGNVSNADPCELEICLCLVSWSRGVPLCQQVLQLTVHGVLPCTGAR
jgi:hypothetical protein